MKARLASITGPGRPVSAALRAVGPMTNLGRAPAYRQVWLQHRALLARFGPDTTIGSGRQ